MEHSTPKTVVVAGASGFVGRALPDALGDDYRLVGLTRRTESQALPAAGYEWRVCDLFSRQQTIDALEGADLAVYLVHSMRPSATLTQGDFRDMDLICADNFARAASRHHVEHIVYVSGIIPERDEGTELDEHLASRLEVERTLSNYGVEVTTLRAAMVVGPGGDLTEMVLRLVERLPVMVLPGWTEEPARPIARDDLVELVRFVLEHPDWQGESFDVAGPEAVSYAQMLEMAAELMGLRRTFFRVPFLTPRLSSAWIAHFTDKPRSMVRPMVESLKHNALPHDTRLQEAAGQTPLAFRDSLAETIERRGEPAQALVGSDDATGGELISLDEPNEARSVQRIPRRPRGGSRRARPRG